MSTPFAFSAGVDDDKLRQLSRGVQLEDGPAAFKTIKFTGGEGINQWYNVTLTEGRNREVRRLWEAVGVQVSRLIRVRYGDILLPKGLPRGGYTELDWRRPTTCASWWSSRRKPALRLPSRKTVGG